MHMQNYQTPKHFITFSVSLVIVMIVLASCSLKRPESAAPLASETGISKDFFTTKVINPKTKKEVLQGKKFMCGWAPVAEVGAYAKIYNEHNVIENWHCNVVFTFNHDHSRLIGKLVNPSYPDDISKWTTALEIPITRNYTREYKKDEYQRVTNEIVEDETRNHPSARPLMDLDFSNMIVSEIGFRNITTNSDLIRPGSSTQNIEDIEIDNATGFIGFTLTFNDPDVSSGNSFERKIRYNFLEMKTNEKFESTPWHEKNASHLNALHILGKKVEGASSAFFAAHWDKYKSRKVYLIGFPEKYFKIAEEALKNYNELFKSQVADKDHPITHDLFIPERGDHLKYSFDLRYTNITWIDDFEKSLNAPLGIGTALADRLTGEIQWGGVTLWGGMIEYIIKSAAPSLDLNSSLPASHGLNWLDKIEDNAFSFNYQFDFPASLDPNLKSTFFNTFVSNSLDKKLLDDSKLMLGKKDFVKAKQNDEYLESFITNQSSWLNNHHNAQKRNYQNFSFNHYFKNLIGNKQNSQSQVMNGFNKDALDYHMNLAKQHLNSPICVISTEDVIADIMEAKERGNFDPEKVMEAFVKDVILHEFGHMIGLGHNMAENILPTVSAVMDLNIHPPKVDENNSEYQDLDDLKKIMQSEKTKYTVPKKYWMPLEKAAKKDMTNASTVMGYKNSRTDVLYNNYKEIVPGPSDVQVLKYLYNQQYATFKYGEADFTYYKVPATGQIPLFAPRNVKDRSSRFVSYFPSCTDFEATFDTSPLCKRWDRGYDEKTLAEDYMLSIDNLRDSKLIAKSELKGARSIYRLENYLYGHNLEMMGRLRLFYDYMRDLFKDEIDSISHDVEAIKMFSTDCMREKMENASLINLFTNNPKLKELCQVNKKIVEKLGSYMAKSGRDFTKIDYKNKTAPGGMSFGDADPNWTQMSGTYQILSDLPFKIVALNTLTLSQPYAYLYGWMLEMENYSHENGGYLYSSLYPNEYSHAIKNAVQNNLQFGINGEKTILKKTALSLGYFLQRGNWETANDKFRFPKPTFLKKISDQTQFNVSYVAIILTAVKMEGNNAPPNRYSSFTGRILDINSGKDTSAGEVFILPDSSILVKGAANTIINPITKLQFYSDTEAFAWAYKISFDSDDNDSLSSESVKNIFPNMVNNAIDTCINGKDGNQNGLKHFFNKAANPDVNNLLENENEYVGFEILPGIAQSAAFQNDFKDSIKDNYQRFVKKFPSHELIEKTCFEALNGIGLTSASAGAINGYWMPGMREYIEE